MGKRPKVPGYRKHKPSGQAVVTLSGRDFYLGPYDTQVSRREYDRVVMEWLANDRRVAVEGGQEAVTVAEVILSYWKYAQGYYVKDGQPSSEQDHLKRALKVVRELYGHTLAIEFGPLALKAVREAFLEHGGSRQKINQNVGRVKRMIKWAAANELVPGSIFHALQAVGGLKRGRTSATEDKKVRPAPEASIEAVLPHVSAAVAGMIRLQLLTGMRPGEVIIMRGEEIDREERIWLYRPSRHKTEHHGHEREVFFGPEAQKVLWPFLKARGDGFLFSPHEAEEARNAKRKIKRKSPMTPSQARRKKKAKRKRAPREHYDTSSYRRAIHRACDREGVERWNPHQLRHNAATALRKQYGIEAARVILGHKSAAVTEIYAEMDRGKAIQIMGEVG